MRARSLKPGLFKNEKLGTSDPLHTIIFEGLWCLADRAGRLEDRPLRIHAEVNPYRDQTSTVQALCWLHAESFIVRYEVGNVPYIEIPGFTSHQNPHVKERPSSIPGPKKSQENQEHGEAPDKHGAGTSLAPYKNETGTSQARLTPDSPLLTPDSGLLTPGPSPATNGDNTVSDPKKPESGKRNLRAEFNENLRRRAEGLTS